MNWKTPFVLCACKRFPLSLVLLLCLCHIAEAQIKIDYGIFTKPPLGQISVSPRQPTFSTGITGNFDLPSPVIQPPFGFSNPQTTIQQQNERMMAEGYTVSGVSVEQRRLIMADIDNDVRELTRETAGKSYRAAYQQLLQLNPDSFTLLKAVFLVENAYFDNQLQFEDYKNGIVLRANLVRQILRREGIGSKSNLALNYGIQKLYSQDNRYTEPTTQRTYMVPRLRYDFDDFMGQKDYSKMFVSKIMATGSGQCHSMPLLYLLIAEQLNAKASLAYAPQHTFIQFADNSGNRMNFEATNGQLVSTTWLTQSGYITATALANKIFMNPLSSRELFAQMLTDLLLGYMAKWPYDQFAEQLRNTILQYNPKNIIALIIDANIKTNIAFQKIIAAGKPKEEDLVKYPAAYQAYQAMQNAYEKVEATGYQDMPTEAYQRWLQSLDREKKKQGNQMIQRNTGEKMQPAKANKPAKRT